MGDMAGSLPEPCTERCDEHYFLVQGAVSYATVARWKASSLLALQRGGWRLRCWPLGRVWCSSACWRSMPCGEVLRHAGVGRVQAEAGSWRRQERSRPSVDGIRRPTWRWTSSCGHAATSSAVLYRSRSSTLGSASVHK